jgi:hypothetical protein
MGGVINNLIHRLWVKAANTKADSYDSKQWEQLDRGVRDLQQAVKEEKKRADYWEAKAKELGANE